MADREGFGVEGRESIYTQEWRIKSRNNLVISWYTGS